MCYNILNKICDRGGKEDEENYLDVEFDFCNGSIG